MHSVHSPKQGTLSERDILKQRCVLFQCLVHTSLADRSKQPLTLQRRVACRTPVILCSGSGPRSNRTAKRSPELTFHWFEEMTFTTGVRFVPWASETNKTLGMTLTIRVTKQGY
ncbi:hypothetical protein MRX96_051323 [Rhipicephalus microplus]